MSEIEKIVEVQDESNAISGFLDWLQESGYAICEYREVEEENPAGPVLATIGIVEDLPPYMVEKWVIKRESHEQLLAKYFLIDLDKVEAERLEFLERIRAQHP